MMFISHFVEKVWACLGFRGRKPQNYLDFDELYSTSKQLHNASAQQRNPFKSMDVTDMI